MGKVQGVCEECGEGTYKMCHRCNSTLCSSCQIDHSCSQGKI